MSFRGKRGGEEAVPETAFSNFQSIIHKENTKEVDSHGFDSFFGESLFGEDIEDDVKSVKKKKKKKSKRKKSQTEKKMFDEEVDKFETYEDYLDSLVSEEDHKYLEDEEMARTIAELGYRFVVPLYFVVLTFRKTSLPGHQETL